MTIFYRVAILVAFSYGMAGCNENQDTTKTSENLVAESSEPILFDRLEGIWVNGNGSGFEHWEKNNDGTYDVDGFTVKASDTTRTEHANVYQENGAWIFENTVEGQNDGKAIKFASPAIVNDQVQFSNPAHDFQTDINYRLVDDTTLKAFIIGPNKTGGQDTIHFQFSRKSN